MSQPDGKGLSRSLGDKRWAAQSAPYQGRFNPHTPYKDLLKGACAVYSGYLWALGNNQSGIQAMHQSGAVIRGGATYGASYSSGNILHPTGDGTASDPGSGLYASTYGTLCQVTYGSKTGMFVMGEQILQPVTNAVGCVFEDRDGVLKIQVKSGTFTGTDVITGGTSGASAIPSSISNSSTARRFLERSVNGFVNFQTVADFNDNPDGAGFLPRCLCDCGVQEGPLFGNSNTRLLIYAEYTNSDTPPRLLANQPEVNPRDWRVLVTSGRSGGENAVRHFHGAIWSSVHEKLFVLAGDTDSQSCILVCDDIASLCENGALWESRWAMNLFGNARATYLTSGDGAPYCVIAGNQFARTVDLVLDADQRYGYYVPDQSVNNANRLVKVNLATNGCQIAREDQHAIGTGWVGICTADGTTLLSCASDFGQQGFPAYAGNNDQKCRIYAVVPETLDLVCVSESTRRDVASPAYPSATFYGTLVQFGGGPGGGPIWAWDYARNLWDGDMVGYLATGPLASTRGPDSQFGAAVPPINLLYNGSFEEGDPGVTNLLQWNATRLDQTVRDQATVDLQQGAQFSFRLRGAAAVSGSGFVTYSLKQRAIYATRGHHLTFKVRCRAVPSLATTQLPWISIGIGTESEVFVLPHNLKSNDWQTLSVTKWVPSNANAITLQMGVRLDGLDTGDVWFSDAALVFGTQPPVAGSPSLNNLMAFLPGFAYGGTFISMNNADYTMTDFESGNLFLDIGGSASAPQNVTMPTTAARFRQWYVYNGTTQAMTLKIAGQPSGVIIGAGKRCTVARDATNVIRLTPDV